MLAAIWTEPDAAEWFFLIAAILFGLEAILRLVGPSTADAGRATAVRLVGFFMAVGLALVALGLLAI